MNSRVGSGVTLALLVLISPISQAGEASFERTEVREACAAYDPQRRPLFGDLHVHTAISLDAGTQGTIKRPADAYRFARGDKLEIQPYDENGRGLRQLKLARPLDFASITDHSELFGEVHVCTSKEHPEYGSWTCWVYREWPRVAFFLMNTRSSTGDAEDRPTRFGFCGPDGEVCVEAARTPWKEIQDAAEAAYDRSSSCEFTSFVAYEWTGAAGLGNNMHRNVIFRNQNVPDLPVSFIEAPHPELFWDQLRQACISGTPGCEVLVIPHNSNLGGGQMFSTERLGGGAISVNEAKSRAEFEVLAEVMQHKGDSECLPGGDTEDELCGFEKLSYSNFAGRFVPWEKEVPSARQFLRNALKEGLLQQAKLGVNPFKYGFIASTDTHLAAPGAADEDASFAGHGGAGRPARGSIPAGLPDSADFNPGGLAVVWAEENSRDAIFAGLQRRETYGTSGTRPFVRFFGGWDYPEDLCDRADFARIGYAQGVPMGGDLPIPDERQAARGPRFALAALRDPGSSGRPGTRLERIQIIKGWLDAGGTPRERVYDVAGQGPDGPGVDLKTCRVAVGGDDALCTTWSDPDFDPSSAAFYYARVIENPTCRWTTHICNAGGVDCMRPDTISDGFEACCDPSVPTTVRERAWTSPIWFTPAKHE
ncbi:MAG: DUF3604 domain-containing protein [bacterium]|nr:DUF3604 domain-containing protein [bacterium]